MDFKIKTDLSVLPKVIEFNHEELKKFLVEKTAAYNSLVVTEDNIKSAKEDKAKLNKFRQPLKMNANVSRNNVYSLMKNLRRNARKLLR